LFICNVELDSTGTVRVTTIGTSHPKLMLMVSTKALLGESRILNYGLVGYYVLSYSATAALVLYTSISLLGKFVNIDMYAPY